jgi:DNA-binding NtrC family response regulator
VDSQPGKGTVFRLFFPAAEPKMPSDGISEAVLPVGTERLLYVEHDSVMGEIGKEMMASLGYSVVMKTSADEALKWIRDDPDRFDALVADARLMGPEHICEVKRAKPAMPLILCRGFSANTKNEIPGGGAHAVLMKPLLEADLARALRAAIDGRRQKRLNASAGAGA